MLRDCCMVWSAFAADCHLVHSTPTRAGVCCLSDTTRLAAPDPPCTAAVRTCCWPSDSDLCVPVEQCQLHLLCLGVHNVLGHSALGTRLCRLAGGPHRVDDHTQQHL